MYRQYALQGFAGQLSLQKRQIDEAMPTNLAPQKLAQKGTLVVLCMLLLLGDA